MQTLALLYKHLDNYFLNSFSESSYELQLKSRLLFQLTLIFLFSFPILLFSVTFIGKGFAQPPFLILLADILFLAVALYLLKRGSYQGSASLIITIMALSLMLSINLDDLLEPNLSYIHTLYFVFAIIFSQVLFGRVKYIMVVPAVYILFAIIAYSLTTRNLTVEEYTIIRGFLVDFTFAVFFVSVIGYLIMTTNHRIIAEVAVKNRMLTNEMKERDALEKEMVKISDYIHRRIGQELHDNLGQYLIAIQMRHKTLKRTMGEATDEIKGELDIISSLIETSISKIRNMAKGVGSVKLDSGNFFSALSELMMFIEETHGISCKYESNLGVELADDLTAINLYHIIQEAINNALNHGKAKSILLRLHQSQNNIEVIISDDGVGFDPGKTASSGSGLRIMKHRADMINADFDIKSDDKGTTVNCRLKSLE